ncbi:terpene synthase [Streptomyces piniterrae]|uniref:Terpene synthase n=1 Tax=Streptomyces piniterrae TaxID=2571125 RepID=A0A4U0N7I9_9ACTN|nr:family 2 encapsulin nanocompartment cargo protein terpene cyclase [Streptomyces piniterrae]TJZ49513.1 terpene synthase [Streptomyces piniterrae]
MSLLSRMSAPAATHELAGLVAALLSRPAGVAPRGLPGAAGLQQDCLGGKLTGMTGRRLIRNPTGLGTSAARIRPLSITGPRRPSAAPPGTQGAAEGRREPRRTRDSSPAEGAPRPPGGPTGPGTSGLRPWSARSRGGASVPDLYCPPPVRDDPALGEEVNERLVGWAEQCGIYEGRLDDLRAANFGRLLMLTHPDTDDPDRLLAAAKCGLAEWAADDHYCDDASAGADPKQLAPRLAIAYAAVDPAHLVVRYAPELERAMRDDPVLVALRSAVEHISRYATAPQVARLQQEMSALFGGFNAEAGWRTTGRLPSVWEYLTDRQFNSFIPMTALIDAVGGYELSTAEYADPRVRRAVRMASAAATLVNDLYSMSKEDADSGFNLPTQIAAEENCSLAEAVERSVQVHDEMVHTFEAEATTLSLVGTPQLRRFLAGLWAWMGGNREWHSTTDRYHGARAE